MNKATKPTRSLEQITAEANKRGRLTRQDVYEALKAYGEKTANGRRTRMAEFLGEANYLDSKDKQKVIDDLESYKTDDD